MLELNVELNVEDFDIMDIRMTKSSLSLKGDY